MNAIEFGLPQFEIKAIDEAGYISGIAAAYGNVDYGNDVIVAGALTKAITGRASVPMLRHHDHKQVVGAWNKFDDTATGLNVEGRFSMRTVAGKEAHALAEDGALPALSIGYKALRHRIEGKSRQLQELRLDEISLVPAGMNDRAVVTQVKSLSGAEDWLKQAITLHRGHLDGSEPTSDASQARMMTMMEKALAQLTGAAPDTMQMSKGLSAREFEEFLRDAGGFSKSLAVAIATKAAPHLRGEPEAKAIDELEQFLIGLRG